MAPAVGAGGSRTALDRARGLEENGAGPRRGVVEEESVVFSAIEVADKHAVPSSLMNN